MIKKFKKRLINIKQRKKDQKCFLWCHARYIKPIKTHLRITRKDKELVNDLNCDGIKFPAQGNDFNKFEMKNNICINVFGYENRLPFPIYISNQKFENSMDLLLVINENESHYVYIKDFDRSVSPNKK